MQVKNQPNETQWQHVAAFFASELFAEVQCQALFADSKTFADAIPKQPWPSIDKAYQQWKKQGDGDLRHFVLQHFNLPEDVTVATSTAAASLNSYIQHSWSRLTRCADRPNAGSLIPLAHPYLVPGGRFREIYYWDSYFSALGLLQAGHEALVQAMIENFIAMQTQLGCIPNGNRYYYRTRSQPPVLALLVAEMLERRPSSQRLAHYYRGLQQEYAFWMQGTEQLQQCEQHLRVVKMPCGAVLNRYYDSCTRPRPESFREDIALAQHLPASARAQFYQDLRAACESGWDFSSRWLADPQQLNSIRTTQLVPVDLNAFLFNLERQLATMARALGEPQACAIYADAAEQRREAMHKYLWHAPSQLFMDWHLPTQQVSQVRSLASVVPLFVGLATPAQAQAVARALQTEFLHRGGLVTTCEITGQQWDAPNGWAPLQWMAVAGLQRYQHTALARTIAQRWCDNVEAYFQQHGVVLEKYDVCQPDNKAGGGEYEVQLGFGWTNGVVMAMQALLAQTAE